MHRFKSVILHGLSAYLLTHLSRTHWRVAQLVELEAVNFAVAGSSPAAPVLHATPMTKAKDLDQFYTAPEVAERFVGIVNGMFPLDEFDMVLEPSAGSGNILRHLPAGSVGLDLEPMGEGIIKQDFFK